MAESIELSAAITALVRLAVVEREERVNPALSSRKIELLLAEVGLTHEQIASATGKTPGAVSKAISRADTKK